MNQNPDIAGRNIVFFVGAGMSAESGVPTYRGSGGIWAQYRYEDYACQRAFDRDAYGVMRFHERRRAAVLACSPHEGHRHLAKLQSAAPATISVVTQNIDGMLQRAGIVVAAELHGSLWRVRCPAHGIWTDDNAGDYAHTRCSRCSAGNAFPLRPDITWFEDPVSPAPFETAYGLIKRADVFVSVGCSAVVMPAASLIQRALEAGAHLIEINPEPTDASCLFHECLRHPAGVALPARFPVPGDAA